MGEEIEGGQSEKHDASHGGQISTFGARTARLKIEAFSMANSDHRSHPCAEATDRPSGFDAECCPTGVKQATAKNGVDQRERRFQHRDCQARRPEAAGRRKLTTAIVPSNAVGFRITSHGRNVAYPYKCRTVQTPRYGVVGKHPRWAPDSRRIASPLRIRQTTLKLTAMLRVPRPCQPGHTSPTFY